MLVYQSLDDGHVYAIDVDRNVTHVVVDSRVIVRLYWHHQSDITCLWLYLPADRSALCSVVSQTCLLNLAYWLYYMRCVYALHVFMPSVCGLTNNVKSTSDGNANDLIAYGHRRWTVGAQSTMGEQDIFAWKYDVYEKLTKWPNFTW